MESLESRLDRLSPEQRKEVEDFVEFLLSRPEQGPVPEAAAGNPQTTNIAPPLLTPVEPPGSPGLRQARFRDTSRSGTADLPSGSDAPAPVPFHEIGGGIQDRLTGDYLDYEQFESGPSPATQAVKKIRRKIVTREGQDKPHHLLDWVD